MDAGSSTGSGGKNVYYNDLFMENSILFHHGLAIN